MYNLFTQRPKQEYQDFAAWLYRTDSDRNGTHGWIVFRSAASKSSPSISPMVCMGAKAKPTGSGKNAEGEVLGREVRGEESL